MDYRKPVTFGENWSPSRYAVLPYFAVEKEVLQRPSSQIILDLGCASGWNMSRFGQYGRSSFGVDVVPARVQLALHHGPVALASGLELPFADGTFDVIYIQHVLHHIGDVGKALAEVHRCLRPQGLLFLIETTEDSPVIRYGRKLYPKWMGDEVNAPFYFADLKAQLNADGFTVQTAQQYSVIFWMWEILPDQLPVLEKLTPIFAKIEKLLIKQFPKQAAHCFYVAIKDES